MGESTDNDWVKVFESLEIMEAELIESRLKDENIELMTLNKSDLGYTVEIGQYWTYNAGKPVEIYVRSGEVSKALKLINEDRSKMLDDPELDFGTVEDQ